jgi:hypothetical protein
MKLLTFFLRSYSAYHDNVSREQHEIMYNVSVFQVSLASKLKHDNLVEMLGYCVDGNYRILAYEFATMGSLHDVLHGKALSI